MWSWENFIKKNKINFMLIREFRVLTMAIRVAQRKLLNFDDWINGGLRSFQKSEF